MFEFFQIKLYFSYKFQHQIVALLRASLMAAGMSDLDNFIHVLTAISILDCVCVCVSFIVHVHVYVQLPVNRRLASMSC